MLKKDLDGPKIRLNNNFFQQYLAPLIFSLFQITLKLKFNVKKVVLFSLYLVGSTSIGQTIFSETIGVCCGLTVTAVTGTTFSNNSLAFVGTADTRTDSPSSDYNKASGSRNVFFTNVNTTSFVISGINTSRFLNSTLRFGHWKSIDAASNQLLVEVSTDGTNYTTLSYGRSVAIGSAGWALVSVNGSIPPSTNLFIRFRQTSTSYTFRVDDIELIGFFDSDGDGVNDNVDIDDDNDGIKDEVECLNFVKPRIYNADFEDINIITSGLDQGPTDVVATLGIWKGTGSNIPNWHSGESLPNNHLEIWHNTQAAGNDLGGRAFSGVQWAEINATTNDGFYQDIVTTPGDVLQWSFAHRKRKGFAGIGEDIARLLIGNPNGTLTSQGDFTSASDASWTEHWGTYTVPAGQTITRLTFTAIAAISGTSSPGNFVDKVQLFVIPNCKDTDGDLVPDYFDLDSDNDGIPDVVESVNTNYSNGTAKIAAVIFIDSNNNGMHDDAEGNIPLDSDSDGVPNFIDLDSDNDSVFDVDESGAGNSSAIAGFENGDGDINGDGVGDGTDSELFRFKDSNNDGVLEYFGDGILDIYDYLIGNTTYADSFGNQNQGSTGVGWINYVKDTDGDGISDYVDVKSNGIDFDISRTLYASLDSNADGIIDGASDSDKDGIVDAFDTNIAFFGSPRNLERKLQLYFDGRNDYMEEDDGVNNIVNGLSKATLMAWVKLDPAFSGDAAIMGQSNFWIRINASKRFRVEINSLPFTVASTFALELNRWTHVAAVYDGSNTAETIKLFINGKKVASTNTAGMRPIIKTSTNTKFRLGRDPSNTDIYNTTADMFKGYMDEVRVFDKALSENELQKMVYQEIEENSGILKGTVIPLNITHYVNETTSTPLPWLNLKRYYRMDVYKDNIIDNLTTPTIDVGTGARIYNTKVISLQQAPLPFITQISDTTLSNALDIPSKGIKGTDAITYDWSIVKIEHKNISYNAYQKHLGLIVNNQDLSSNPIIFKIQNDSELNVSWYLELDGVIDLVGESQLVQEPGSILDADSGGYLDRDQQGTQSSYNYNYWSSNVGPISGNTGARGTGVASTNANFTIAGRLMDASTTASPLGISFGASHTWADGAATIPKRISSYWLYKFYGPSNDYNSWIKINQTTALLPGEGYTMKGTSGTAAITDNQNYKFRGKPYNGDFTLPLDKSTSEKNRLIGNPYPSALNADEFIKDNIAETINSKVGRNAVNVFNGVLYFWHHFSGKTHVLAKYVGGYATYTLMGGIEAISIDSRINANLAEGNKVPERYIPVNQGFFVNTSLDAGVSGSTPAIQGGNIVFKNSQREFKREGASSGVGSLFFKGSDENNVINDQGKGDTRPKIRLHYSSPKGYHRALLVGADINASNSFDLGYDAPIADVGEEDMFWKMGDTKLVIQAINNFNEDQELPLGIKTEIAGLIKIKIQALENVDKNTEIFIKDNLTGETYKINDQPFEINLEKGEYVDRFSVVFQPRLFTKDEMTIIEGVKVFMNNHTSELTIKKIVDADITGIQLVNYLGQTIQTWKGNYTARTITLPVKQATGVYIVQVFTSNGKFSKKIIIE
ncbi:LamG-like jellyroll fold domain-containing protein [Lutibacter sp.]|uniref:LamG-like jellyroll fold domain-containing protein n=1 Tax=Lutibacter sp. TaxID=1925666 RepID=UPI00273593B6|nr:LamG-like jellyroll fold domain-containing protein [Lutibacter sp.]MDP3313920.1 LamG-like jellyroll fold domain-containing protein [Lutibacter sp.]